MIDVSRFGLFLGAAFVLLVVPGPAVLYIVARSIDQGRLAGGVSAVGVGFGNLVHVLAAARDCPRSWHRPRSPSAS